MEEARQTTILGRTTSQGCQGKSLKKKKTTSKAPLHPKVEEKGLKMLGISTSESSRGKIKQDEKYLDIPGKKRKV